MSPVLRRLRAHSGHFALLTALALLAALLVGGIPRLRNEFLDRGLQAEVTRLPQLSRDLTYQAGRSTAVPDGEQLLPGLQAGLPAPLPGLVEQRWFATDVDLLAPQQGWMTGPAPFDGDCTPLVRIRSQSGTGAAVSVVEGRAPAGGSRTTEVMVERGEAAEIGLRLGTDLRATSPIGIADAPVRVVGFFERRDASDPFWDQLRLTSVVCPVPEDGRTYQVAMLTDEPGIRAAGRLTNLTTYSWRFRLDARRMTADAVPDLAAAVAQARRFPPRAGFTSVTSLDSRLAGFDASQRAARAVFAVVYAGVVTVLAGVLVLASLLLASPRAAEFTLIRARGAATRTVLARTAAETALVAPLAVLAGWALSLAVPGRGSGATPWLELLLLVAATLLPPLLAAVRPGAPAGNGPRRVAAELFVVLLAALAVVLIRRRGLSGGVDVFLALTPVLVTAAAGLLVVRILPVPLRRLAGLAARSRGIVSFLGLVRTGRGRAMAVLPLTVLTAAISTAIFTGAVGGMLDDARDRATDQEIGADAQMTGNIYAASTTGALREVPGVEAVSPVRKISGVELRTAEGVPVQTQVVIMDGASADRVMQASGVSVRTPAALTATGPSDVLPAVASAEIAESVGAGGRVFMLGVWYEFRVAQVAEHVPGQPVDASRFLAIPWNAIPPNASSPLLPSAYLIAGRSFDAAALEEAGDTGQREYYLGVLQRQIDAGITGITNNQLPRLSSLRTWDEVRAELDDTGANAALSVAFVVGASASLALALVAVALMVVADSASRGRALSRLRTMGLSARQGRGLLVYELGPPLLAAVLAGVPAGVLLPWLLGPALGLDAVTAGVAARVEVPWWLPAGALALVVLGLLTAVLVEHVTNRRQRLGEVLRLGEES